VPLSHHFVADRSTGADHLSDSDEEDKDAFPEDTWAAWTCLLGSFLMMFPSFGFQTASKELAEIKSLLLIITDFVQLDPSRTISILTSSLIIASAMSDGSQLCLCS
jgi:hypothetical protein